MSGADSKVRIVIDVSVLVFKVVTQRGLRPGPRTVDSPVGEAGEVVLGQAVEGAVEWPVGIVNGVHVERGVVVLEAAELVLPRARPADREIAAGQQVVLVRVLVRVRRQLGISVEPPVRLNAGPIVVVTRAQTKCHAIGKSHAHISALQRVGIGVVHSLALRVELVGEDVVVENSARSRQRRVAVGAGKISAIGAELNFRRARAAGRAPKLHHAGHGVGSIHRAFGAAFHLEPVDVVHGDNAEIEDAAGIVHRHAIHQYLVVIGLAAAHEQAGEIAAPPCAADDGSGNVEQGIGSGDGIDRVQLLAGQHADRGACLLRRCGRCGGGDDHGLRGGRKLQFDVEDRRRRNRNSLRLLGESRGEHYQAILPVGEVRERCRAVAGSGLHGDPGVIGDAKQADLHSGDALAGRALYGYFEIGRKRRCRTQQHDENSTKNGRETNAEHDTLLYTRKGLVT